MILVHQDFQGAHYYHHFGGDPNAREKHRDALTDEEWKLAEQFADEWDQKAFDPDYDTLPLEHFEERVRKVFASAQIIADARASSRPSVSRTAATPSSTLLSGLLVDDREQGRVGVAHRDAAAGPGAPSRCRCGCRRWR